ncbi:hypothetical protein CCHR01_04961 [Colletotrichum chrysophilum]|uniref:Uncharacterized protein n=1 Tax=Colletotrichum chrysophilum TaxID=1836956 RepID=A0AAD9ATH3_9PEZI|nr:hypothetical protein CCHR01_04961 [Colletotrichum chrysophilum]
MSLKCSQACIGASHCNGPEAIHIVEGPEAMGMPSGPSTSPARASLLTSEQPCLRPLRFKLAQKHAPLHHLVAGVACTMACVLCLRMASVKAAPSIPVGVTEAGAKLAATMDEPSHGWQGPGRRRSESGIQDVVANSLNQEVWLLSHKQVVSNCKISHRVVETLGKRFRVWPVPRERGAIDLAYVSPECKLWLPWYFEISMDFLRGFRKGPKRHASYDTHVVLPMASGGDSERGAGAGPESGWWRVWASGHQARPCSSMTGRQPLRVQPVTGRPALPCMRQCVPKELRTGRGRRSGCLIVEYWQRDNQPLLGGHSGQGGGGEGGRQVVRHRCSDEAHQPKR